MTHGDLFAGIGGFALAARWCGIRTIWAVEIEKYCQRVYAKHFPDVEMHSDVKTIKELPGVDLLTAGFPCQAVSVAGKRLGTDDERWLWPDTIRIIRLVRPRWVLLENVPGLLGRGMSDVLGDLAASGYDAEWSLLSACFMGAPHTRERVFIVAYPNNRNGKTGLGVWRKDNQGTLQECRNRTRLRSNWLGSASRIARSADGIRNRVDRTEALGNAIVPQVAEWIMRQILEADGVKAEIKDG